MTTTNKKSFYNIGAGAFNHPDWINLDYESESYKKWYKDNGIKNKIDINFNLMSLKRLPIESDSALIVYTSHTIEHLSDEAAQRLFCEVYRILKKGGTFRITAPNAEVTK